ncbi:MAG: fibronectin type III domain-containing protein, partial [Bacteroidota bacterium]
GNCWNIQCYHADYSYSPVVNNPPAPTSANHQLLNNDHNLSHGGKVHLTARNLAGSKLPNDASLAPRAFPGFVLFPQNLNGWDANSVQNAIRLLRLVIKKYNIDENRVYIHGLSNGGHGVYEAIKRAPWLFAAALPMSAIDDGFIINQKMAPKVAVIPLWVFQGQLDTNPWPGETENLIKVLRSAGAEVRYTKYQMLGHNTWGAAYSEPDFFTWILSKNKSNLHVFAGSPTICKTEGSLGLKLEMPEGYKAYQWQKDGQTISGATSSSYTATTRGSYQGRFSRVSATPSDAQWNRWSDPVTVTEQTAPQAKVKQIGTILLRDLNNFNDAILESDGEFGHYYWYKDGVLINQPGDQDDTVKQFVIKAATGNGAYTLIVSNYDNCTSLPSAAKNVFFSDQAPLNITSPANFRGQASSPSTILLNWSDASANENGFEIWRRKKLNESSYSLWQMAVLTNSNVSSYLDTGLEPSSTYQYKIRAVSNSGRSNYTPPGAAEYLTINTLVDTQPPSVPQDLMVTNKAVRKISLRWKASTDNTGVHHYVVYFNKDSLATVSADTTFILIANLKLNTNYNIHIRAVDLNGNYSSPSREIIVDTYVSGLYYEHTTGAWPELDSINWINPEFTGKVSNFTLKPKTQADFFNFRFDGYLYIATAGSYQFRTTSNDGSRLKLNGAVLVDNDGIHNMYTVTSASTALPKGEQRITVDFFEYVAQDSLVVEYKGPDSNNTWIKIPDTALKSHESVITVVAPDIVPEKSFHLSIYPNPSSGEDIHIRIHSTHRSTVNIVMLDMMGRSMFNATYDFNQAERDIRISPRESLANGIYIIVASQEGKVVQQKILISN